MVGFRQNFRNQCILSNGKVHIVTPWGVGLYRNTPGERLCGVFGSCGPQPNPKQDGIYILWFNYGDQQQRQANWIHSLYSYNTYFMSDHLKSTTRILVSRYPSYRLYNTHTPLLWWNSEFIPYPQLFLIILL